MVNKESVLIHIQYVYTVLLQKVSKYMPFLFSYKKGSRKNLFKYYIYLFKQITQLCKLLKR